MYGDPVNTTPTTAPEVKNLPPLDTAQVEADAAAWVDERLTRASADGAAMVAADAASLVLREERAAEKARHERDHTACGLLAHYTVRRGADVAGALGVQRSRWNTIRDRAAADHGYTRIITDRHGRTREVGDWNALMADPDFKFPYVENADKALPKLALKAATHTARAECARRRRDAAVEHLLTVEGKSNAEVARIIGRDPSRVSHIKHREAVA